VADEDGDCFCPDSQLNDETGLYLCDFENDSDARAERCLDADGLTCTPSAVNSDFLLTSDASAGGHDARQPGGATQ